MTKYVFWDTIAKILLDAVLQEHNHNSWEICWKNLSLHFIIEFK